MSPPPDNPPKTPSGRSRYPGTRPFCDTPDDHALFFGRGEESEQLYLRVLSVPLVVQFGRSGLGKTSLLQAALFPRLRQKPFLSVMVRLNVGPETPTHAVADAMQQACEIEGLEFNPGCSDGLWELLSTTTVWRDDLLLTPVIVFDQFEEVFTLRDAKFRTALAAELGSLFSGTVPDRVTARSGSSEAAAARPCVKVVISLREDYLGALEEFSAAIPNLFHERLRLEPLNDKMAREAVIRPAQLDAAPGEEPYASPRFEFEPAALDSMVAYLKGTSGVIEPFQLQLLCRYAEAIASRKASASGGPVQLALADFSGSQGFDSVLKNFYRDTILQLDGPQQKKAEVLCEEGLLDASGHRLMLEEAQISNDFGVTLRSLAMLAHERLLRRERRMESAFYEISHDRLAESILRAKRFRLPKKWRRALWTAAVVAPLILFVVVLWIFTLAREKKKVDSLNGFLLGNFLEEVRDIGRSTMLSEVQGKMKDLGNLEKMSPLNRGLALRNRGDLEHTHGSVADAAKSFAQAIEAFSKSDDQEHKQRELARTHDRLGEVLSDQGEVTQALHSYDDAIQSWRQVAAASSTPATEDCTSLADSLVSAGELRSRMGDATHSLENLEEAASITSGVLFPYHESPSNCGSLSAKAEPYPDAKALEVLGRAALLRAVILNFTEDYEGSAALAAEARRLNPASISAREQALVAIAWRGNSRLGTPQRAIDDYQTALKEFGDLRRWDPSNRSWQRQRAANLLILSEGIVTCHTNTANTCPSLEEAQAINLEAIAVLRALSSTDPANASWQGDLAWSLQDEAKVLAASDRHLEQLAMQEKAEPLYHSCQRDPADSEITERLGVLLTEKSDALADLGRLAEAKQALQASVELFKQLIAAHPDAPGYVNDLSFARKKEATLLRKEGDLGGASAADAEIAELDKKYSDLTRVRHTPSKQFMDALVGHINAGSKLYAEKQYRAALREFDAAEAAGRKYVSLRPAAGKGYDELRNTYLWVANSQMNLADTKERTVAQNAAMQAAQIAALLAREDQQTQANVRLLEARHSLGIFLYDSQRVEDALTMVQEEVAVAEHLVQSDQQNALYLWKLGNAQCGLGMLRRTQKGQGWEEAIRSGLIQEEKAAALDAKHPDYPNDIGSWRAYLAAELKADGRSEEAKAEYQLARKTYQDVAKRFPGNETAAKGLRELTQP